ncbi:hypothetical protein CWI38_1207p0030 [Hamiltosporidium tvaerminnensis]|uniref:Uncharacterized protein n=1 Tax=Hamiltosporidium tvaerminnensis TaxID=1176355 RepID=A0A4Q9LTF8_9MICR|nr:hypothetical protein CWI38_1207p0030 [Hamiltosporidium tvaerminnensis]
METEYSIAHSGINRMIALIGKKYYGIPRTFIIKYAKVYGACSRFNYLKKIQKIYMKNITNTNDIFMIDCVNLRKYANQKDGIVGPEKKEETNDAVMSDEEISYEVLTAIKNDPECAQLNLDIASEMYNEINEYINNMVELENFNGEKKTV